jgi:hypothetical protein
MGTAATECSSSTRLYGGWQRERTGFLFGMSGGRFTVAVLALLLALTPIASHSLPLLVLCWPIAALLGIVVTFRVAGATVVEWAGTALAFVDNQLRGRNHFLSGPFAPRSAVDPTAPVPIDLPGTLAPLRFLEADTHGLLGALAPSDGIAVVFHPQDRTYTAVARVRHPGILLADPDRRDARLDAWGGFLAGLCSAGGPFTRIGVLHRALPDDGTALRAWTAAALRPDAPALARETVEELVAEAAAIGAAHDTWLTFTLDERLARAQIRAAGGGHGGALMVMVSQLAAMTPALGAAHLEVVRWLGLRDVAEVVRTAFDPHAVGLLALRRAEPAEHPAGEDPRLAGPAAAQASWRHYRHDGAWSVSYAIEWPRSGVPAWFLHPLLSAQQSARRNFALHIEPLPPREAQRLLMRARTTHSVTVGMRHRIGQLVPEHERLAEADAHVQDAQRAEGHGLVRLAGHVTVTVTDFAQLELACLEIEADGNRCGLTLRRLWGAQDVGFQTAALPLGLGLPNRRISR